MVGHLGVEPSSTALSEQPPQPVELRPLSRGLRCRAPRPVRTATGFRDRVHRRVRILQVLRAEDVRFERTRVSPQPPFQDGAIGQTRRILQAPGHCWSGRAARSALKPGRSRRVGIRLAGSLPESGISLGARHPERRAEVLTPTSYGAHPLATEPGSPARFALLAR